MLDTLKSKIACFDKFENFTNLLDTIENIEIDISHVINFDFYSIFIEPLNNITSSLFNNSIISDIINELENKEDSIISSIKSEMTELENKVCDLGNDFREQYLL